MSRLSKVVVAEREEFVRSLVRVNPSVTGVQLQHEVQTKFGKMMRPNRIYALKEEVQAELAGSVPTVTATDGPSSPVVFTHTDTSTTVTV